MALIRLDVPESVERDRTVNAVRSPALPVSKRYIMDRQGYKQEYQKSLVNEAEGRRKDAIKPDAGRDTTNAEQQQGIPLSCEVIMGRLMKLNSRLLFERSINDPSRMGIYLKNPTRENGQEYLFAMESGISPEFGVKKVDKDGECVGVIKGYRDVLGALINKKLISEPKAIILFGHPSKDSQFWQMRTT